MAFFLLFILMNIYQCILGIDYIPWYSGQGPRNVYYCTGAGEKLFEGTRQVWNNQDGWSLPYIALRDAYLSKGYNFYTKLPDHLDENFSKDVFLIFIHNVPSIARSKQFGLLTQKMVILALEPPHVWPLNYDESAVKYYSRILTWHDGKVDNKKYFKYYMVQSFLSMIDDIVPFYKKKLCTLIGGNKNTHHPGSLYQKRREAIEFFEKYAPHAFDLYGTNWDKRKYKTYKGSVENKTSTFKKYKFAICYENIMNQPGYISEKIFGCFIAGCVPIYWGAQNIDSYIPSTCFIDKRKFSTMHSLYQYLNNMDEATYNQYLENIRLFLASNDAYYYSIEHFVETLTYVAHSIS